MTHDEALVAITGITPEQTARLYLEHHELKQALCAQTLSIPTGTEDWIERSIKRAHQLREIECQFRKVIHGATTLIEEAKWRTSFVECTNCMGRRTIQGESCCICGGTGRRIL